ncbi:hypothetical protein ACWGI8_35755 [Streptomyces sp. NPDC054841]
MRASIAFTFVYFKGGLSVQSSKVLVAGHPKPYPDYHDNLHPSDHAAVLSTFRVR